MNIANRFIRCVAIGVIAAPIALFGATAALAQESITVPLSRPGEPLSLHVDIISAHIEVIGEERKDVSLAITMTGGQRKIVTPSGPKTLLGGGAGLEINERDNRVSIESDGPPNPVTIVARVPRRAKLDLSTVNEGEIVVRDIVGDLQLENVNGPITATNINGSVIAESVNAEVVVGLAAVAPGGATSISTLNGDITLTLPSSVKTELHLDSGRGEIASDFELDIKPAKPLIERNEHRGGVSVKMENVVVATINGGGPVIRIKTYNGDIKLSKGAG